MALIAVGREGRATVTADESRLLDGVLETIDHRIGETVDPMLRRYLNVAQTVLKRGSLVAPTEAGNVARLVEVKEEGRLARSILKVTAELDGNQQLDGLEYMHQSYAAKCRRMGGIVFVDVVTLPLDTDLPFEDGQIFAGPGLLEGKDVRQTSPIDYEDTLVPVSFGSDGGAQVIAEMEDTVTVSGSSAYSLGSRSTF